MTQHVEIVTTAAAGTTAWIPLDVAAAGCPFNVQLSLNRTGAGTSSSRIDYTLDNVMDAGVSAYAITLRTVEDATAFNVTHPMEAVRLVVTSGSGTNNLTLRVLQAGR